MSRLTPLDRALVLILVPLWVVCFALGVRTQVRGATIAFVGLSIQDAESYPTLTGYIGESVHSSDLLAESGLRAGDRLIRLGDADLLGVGTIDFTGLTLEATSGDVSVPLVFERDDDRQETSLALVSVRSFSLPMLTD